MNKIIFTLILGLFASCIYLLGVARDTDAAKFATAQAYRPPLPTGLDPDRFTIIMHGSLALRLDTATGATWYLHQSYTTNAPSFRWELVCENLGWWWAAHLEIQSAPVTSPTNQPTSTR